MTNTTEEACANCGASLPERAATGRPRLYCGQRCRRRVADALARARRLRARADELRESRWPVRAGAVESLEREADELEGRTDG